MSKFLDEHGLEVLWDKIKKADALKADKTALDTTNNTVNGILDGDKPLVNPVIAPVVRLVLLLESTRR